MRYSLARPQSGSRITTWGLMWLSGTEKMRAAWETRAYSSEPVVEGVASMVSKKGARTVLATSPIGRRRARYG
eukprot:9616546-Alexandrium_andersonii.AAC.1